MVRRSDEATHKKYWTSPAGIVRIQGWAMDGFTNEEIAKMMGIARSTFQAWLAENKELRDAVAINKEIADRTVENAAFKLAKGFHYRQEHIGADGEIYTTNEYSKPNFNAIKFWLMNRKSNTWRDRTETELSGSVDTHSSVDFSKMSDKEVERLAGIADKINDQTADKGKTDGTKSAGSD